MDPTLILVDPVPPFTPTLVPFRVPTPPVTWICPAVVELKSSAPPVATIPLVLAPITTFSAFPAFASLLCILIAPWFDDPVAILPFTFNVGVVITTAGLVVELELPITVVPDDIVTLAAVVLVPVVAVVVIVNSPPADILPHVDMLPLLALAIVSVFVRLIAPAELIGPTFRLPVATCSVTELPPLGLP